MAKRKMNCPFSGRGCKECSIYRGRHYFLCFSKRYRGVVGDRAEDIEEAVKNTTFFPSSRDEKQEIKVPLNKWDKTLYGNETVLIVEDDAFWQDFINWVLYDTGYKIIISESKEAFEIFSRHMDRLDLILADAASSGKGLIRYAKSRKPSIKTILTTGNYTGLREIHTEGAINAIIQKPYSSYTLARTVRDVLDGKVMFQESPEGTQAAR